MVGLANVKNRLIWPKRHSHPRFKVTPEVSEDCFSAFLGCPIIHHRKVLGVLTIQQSASRVFSEDEESFLVTLGVQLASVLDACVDASVGQSEFQSTSHRTVAGLTRCSWHCHWRRSCAAALPVTLMRFHCKKADDPEKELSRFYRAVKITKAEFNRLADRMSGHLPADALAIFDVYHQLLDAASLGSEIEKQIHEGWCAKSALKRVVEKFARQFDDMDDPYLRERGTDIRDLGQRVLNHLLDTEQRHHKLPEKVVLVADNVTATMLAEIPRAQLGRYSVAQRLSQLTRRYYGPCSGYSCCDGGGRAATDALAKSTFNCGWLSWSDFSRCLLRPYVAEYQALISEDAAAQCPLSV